MIIRFKKAVYLFIDKMMGYMWFQSLWAWYISRNSKYDIGRYKNAFFISKKKGKKRYCILRCQPTWAILAAARNTLISCEWAESYNMIPVIDFEQEDTYRCGELGKDNFWEWIFKQQVSVEEALRGDYVFVGVINTIYSNSRIQKRLLNADNKGHIIIRENDYREYYQYLNIYARKWWKLQDDVQERFTETYKKLFKSDMKILGVFLREEFSMSQELIKGSKYESHPHHLNVDEMIPVIKKYKEEWNCTHIFVSTMFEESMEELKIEFGDKLIYTSRERMQLQNWINDWVNYQMEIKKGIERNYNNYTGDLEKVRKNFIEYVEEVYGISLCNCFLAGKSSGALVACIWNGGRFEHLKILEDTHKSIEY